MENNIVYDFDIYLRLCFTQNRGSIMRIAVLGSGNMGCALSIMFSQEHDVTLFSNSTDKVPLISKNMQLYTEDTNQYLTGKIINITNSLNDAVSGAEYIFITFPAFMFANLANRLVPLLSCNQHLVFVPGSGGAEWFFKDALTKGCTITGLQRVHAVVRIFDFGKLVKQSGIRDSLKIASLPHTFNVEACKALSFLFSIKIEPLDNYLNVTLVNSNPILHTSRMYSIFKDYPAVSEYDSIPMFYKDWDIASSETLISLDKELFELIDVLNSFGMKINQITSILDHYESYDANSLTNKICSINSLKGITTPSIKKTNGKYIPDLSSRYFVADFPYGLDIIIALTRIYETSNYNLVRVSSWYHSIINSISDDINCNLVLGNSAGILEFYRF